MKKNYTFLLFVAISQIALAQPNLNGSDLNPVIGEQITYTRATAMQPHGANGSNVTWDFSSASPMANATVSMTASNSAHPGTNLVHDYAGQAQLYYQNDNTQQSIKYQFASGVLISFSDQMKMLQLPLNNNSGFTDAFAATFSSGGINFSRTGNTTVTYMGYGTMITPNGTYSSCIKIKLEQIYSDVFSGGTINYNTTAYYWYKAGYHYPVATSVMFSDDLGTNEEYTDYYASSTVGIENQNSVDFTLYPNPATDVLTIQHNNIESLESATVVDLMGKIVPIEIIKTPFGEWKLNISELVDGTYLLQIKLKNGNVTTSKFEKK
ncbi:MAG: T9SS type A sorting domain-containing protein [Bacteroidota bacterium]